MIKPPKMKTLLALKVYDSNKEYFLYQLDYNNIVCNYILTNDIKRHINKFNNNFKLVCDMRVLINKQLSEKGFRIY